MKVLNRYDAAVYNEPLWTADTIYQENVCVVRGEDGVIADIPLLLPPARIVSVRNYGLDHEYLEGRDYVVTPEGRLHIPEGSTCPAMDDAVRYIPWSKTIWWQAATLDKDFRPMAAAELAPYQLSVSYVPACAWDGPVPADEGDRLPRLRAKLKNGEAVTMAFYGDSHVTGGDSSAWHNIPPYAPVWPAAVHAAVCEKYPAADIAYVNTAKGGIASDWGLENVQERVIAHKPDVLVMKFGGNEPNMEPAAYREITGKIIAAVHEAVPDCEFVLVSALVHDPAIWLYRDTNYAAFEQELYTLQQALDGCHIAVAPVNTLTRFMLERKGYIHMTANNINHPNDFAVRAYIHTVLQTMGMYRA